MYGAEQTNKVTIRQRISEFIGTSRRILIVSQKPSWLEYKTMAKVTALGIALIAVIDFNAGLQATWPGHMSPINPFINLYIFIFYINNSLIVRMI